jgi:uncharacterized protein
MDAASIITATADHVRQLLSGEGTGHDWWHIHRVWRTAVRIGTGEKASMVVVELAALLHDIADWKFHGTEAGSSAAREWLEQFALPPPDVDHVCGIIDTMSFKGSAVPTPMKTLEGRVVQDADRLDAMGAIGIARAFAYGGYRGQPLHDPAQPPATHASFEAYQKHRGTTVNHFYEKLLLLKERMNTPTGRSIAGRRHLYMLNFLETFYHEWEGTDA